jgi:hypothetical protein
MKKNLILLCFFIVSLSAKAQDYYKSDTAKTSPSIFIIRLKDGTQLLGRIIEQNTVQSKVQTENMGLITIPASQIISMELYEKSKSSFNKTYFENRFANRFSFTPSAFPMEEKSVEYHNVMLYYSEFAAAITSRLSIGVGFFTVIPTEFYNLKAKINLVSSERFNVSVTGNHLGGKNIGSTSVIIPSISLGKKDNFFNISPVFFVEKTNGSFGLSIGYMKKTSPNLTFFTENFFALGNGLSIENGFVFSGGLRFDRLRHAFDLNIIVPTGLSTSDNNLYIIPTVGYHLKLSK